MIDALRMDELVGAVVSVPSGAFPIAAGLLSLLLLLACLAAWRRSTRWRKEAARLRATLDAIGAPVVVTDERLAILDANSKAMRLLDLRKRSPRRLPLTDRLDVGEEFSVDRIHESMERQGTAVLEAEVRRSDAPVRQFRLRLSTLESSGPKRLVVLLEDVSEERAQTEHYERFLDYLIRNVPAEVSILTPDGRYRYLSSSFLMDEGRQAWLVGKTDFDFCRESGLHSELALRRRAHRMEAVDRGETVYFDEELTFDGVSRRLSWRYVPFAGDDGEVMMVLGFGLDQSELIRGREQLAEAQEESAKAVRLKEALLQNVSHEIRTPLSGIIATAQMLRTEIDPALRDFMSDIEENGRRLSATLNDMLDLAGLQAENMDLNPSIVDVSTELEEVVREVRPAAERRGLFLEFSATEPEILICADRDGLARCVKSLAENAVKFTPEGGVVVDVSQRDGYAYIRVMDTGVGIGRSLSRDVFEAFRQGESGRDRPFEGAGLGLAVTERLVGMMGGEIRVHSRKGAGSSFVVRMPLVMPLLKEAAGARRRVLVADTHDESHRLIRHLVQDLVTLESVYAAADLAELASARPFDVVLADARLDVSGSASALRKLLSNVPSVRDARHILMDHDARSGRRRALAEAGWDGHIAKPITRLALLNVLYPASPAPEHSVSAH